MDQELPFVFDREVKLKRSSLVVGWMEDVGRLGSTVIDYIVTKLGAQQFAEVDPNEFFSLGGVVVERDVAQFPEGRLYFHQEKNLVLMKSNAPRSDWYRYLDAVLSLCQQYCGMDEIYTVGGMVSFFTSHYAPRDLIHIVNSQEMKDILAQHDVPTGFDYETPPGQRPTLSTYMLWVAKRRMISGAGLWSTVPFYLMRCGDFEACRKTLQFLDARLGLGIDLADLDVEVAKRNEEIDKLKARVPEIEGSLRKLEDRVTLSQEESERLMRGIEDLFGRGGWG